jgi:hypothetical protein
MIEFRRIEDDNKEIIVYRCHDHLTLTEMMQEFRYFLLALGYHPDGVEEHIEAE